MLPDDVDDNNMDGDVDNDKVIPKENFICLSVNLTSSASSNT